MEAVRFFGFFAHPEHFHFIHAFEVETDTAFFTVDFKAIGIFVAACKARRFDCAEDLARTLNHLGVYLADADLLDEADSAIMEAVDIYRKLSERQPERFLADLAAGLNNLSLYMSEAGSTSRAISAAEEAVGIYRFLSKQQP